MAEFESLTCFLEKLNNDEFGTWEIDTEHKGTRDDPMHFPYPIYTEVVDELIRAIYDFADNHPEYGLKNYPEIKKKYHLENIESADIDSLNAEAVLALLIWVVRWERFCDGLILGNLKNDGIQHLLRRLKELDSMPLERRSVRVVAAIICDSMERKTHVLATTRGYGNFKGQWEFPGGKIEEGETPEVALKREIEEELDVEIEVGDLLTTVEYDYPTFHLVMDCYWSEIKEGEIVLLEADEARWLSYENIASVQWLPADKLILGKVCQELLKVKRGPMWLKLKVDGDIDVHFRVRNYHQPAKEADEWSVIDLSVKSRNLDYSLYDDESLEVNEVAELENMIDKALAQEGEDCMTLDPTEPYMIFNVYPRKTYYDSKPFPFMEWKLILWDDEGAPTESVISLAVNEEEMKLLSLYLKYARNEIERTDPRIAELIVSGNLYGDDFEAPKVQREDESRCVNAPLSPKKDEYIFCDVYFIDSERTYCYIADEDSYSEGDFVLVPAGWNNHLTVVRIDRIRHYTEENAPYPVEKTKHIIRALTDKEADDFSMLGTVPEK